MTGPGSYDAAGPPPSLVPTSVGPPPPHGRATALALLAAVVAGALFGGWLIVRHQGVARVVTVDDAATKPTSTVPSSADAAVGAADAPWRQAVDSGEVEMTSSPGVLAMAPGITSSNRLRQLLGAARGDVSTVLGRSAPALVAYLPASDQAFRDALGSAPSSPGVAAVTTRVDAAAGREGSAAILLNPSVFPTLTPTAQHVVVTHEATHVATGALDATGPVWLQEGLADYVALRAVEVPTDQVAAEAIRWLRHHRAPAHWPADRAFAGSAAQVRVAYELAWVGVRQLVRDHGQQRFLHFYHAVEGGVPSTEAARTILAATPAQLRVRFDDALRSLPDAG